MTYRACDIIIKMKKLEPRSDWSPLGVKGGFNLNLNEVLRGLRRDRRKKIIFGTPPET